MNAVTFHVPGKPHGKARAKTVRNKHTGNTMSYTPETDLLYENYIKDRFLNKCNGMFLERGKPVTLRIVARFLPPKSTSKKRTALAWSLCIVGASADEQLEMIHAKDLERKEQREKLSRVIQCDRCGKTYEKNERYQTRGSVEGSVLSGITTITGMGLRDESYDLCDECIGELLDWLRNEQNDEGAEK